MINESAQKLGRMGGKATAEKYGKKGMSELGKSGARKRWAHKVPSYIEQMSQVCKFGHTHSIQFVKGSKSQATEILLGTIKECEKEFKAKKIDS